MALCLMSQDEDGLVVLSEAVRLAEDIGDLECLGEALVSIASIYE